MLPGPADGDHGDVCTVFMDLCRDGGGDQVDRDRDRDRARLNGRVCTGRGVYIPVADCLLAVPDILLVMQGIVARLLSSIGTFKMT